MWSFSFMTESTETSDGAGADILEFPTSRAPPPPSLTAAQGTLWTEILATLARDWINFERALLLSAYVRTVTSCDFIAAIMEKRQPDARFENRHVYGIAAKAFHKQTLLLIWLATKLGFTQSRTMRAETAATRSKGGSKAKRRPWMDSDR
jgi:hypothetical protein